MASCSLSSFSGSTFAVASSKMIIGASLRMALAMEIRCFRLRTEWPPTLADHGIITLGKGTDKLIAAGFFRRFYYFLVGSLRTTKLDVAFNGIGKEVYLLKTILIWSIRDSRV